MLKNYVKFCYPLSKRMKLSRDLLTSMVSDARLILC